MDNKEKIKILKQQLTEEIKKENSDNSLILSLSNEIAKLDETDPVMSNCRLQLAFAAKLIGLVQLGEVVF